ncbi:MATE family efflux transporter [Antarcticirhabdus aurantiaca]|uniref:MATE family efflux transporter n=1 Tax=Antarcticirhabdus aurantiaca TaxID=2606717 RepID=A0ACD4NQZ3_9HYPH|nr:MATE family efflux transporter [Antarcticirhabdus aurantiaca]WAJ29350.1 MATE family efflux transporter [Jeongeuplla avenae]
MSASGASAPRPFTVDHRAVLRIALPMILTHLSSPLVGFVAAGVVGRLGDAALLGGVALAAVIFDVVFVSCNFLRGATTGFTAQAVGAGDRAEEQSMLLGGLAIALGIGLSLLLLQGPVLALGLAALSANGPVAEAASAYFAVRVWSAPFVLVNYVVFGWLLGRGDAGLALAMQTLLNGFNIALSLLFVLHLEWGVEGAALSSLLAEGLTAAAGAALLLARTSARHWHLSALIDPARVKRLFAVNADMLVRSLALLVGLSFFTRESGGFGTDVLAANTILLRYYFVAVAFLDGIAAAAEQLAGRSVGARHRPAFEATVRLTTLWGVLLALLLSAAILVTGPGVIAFMAPTQAVQDAASQYLVWVVLLPLSGVVAFQMDGIFIGATWSREMRNMMLLSLAVYLATWSVAEPLFGNHGLWFSLLVFQGVRSIVFRIWMARLVPRTFGGQPVL